MIRRFWPNRSAFRTLALLLFAHLLLTGRSGAAEIDTRVVRGDSDLIPINPDFNPGSFLPFSDAAGNTVNLAELGMSGFLDATGIANIDLAFSQDLSGVLGAALAQSLSASNRPSVLTPYAGILEGEGAEAVWDTFGSLITNKASTLGRGKFGIGLSYQHAQFEDFDGDDIGKEAGRTFIQEQSFRTVDNDPERLITEAMVINETVAPFRTRTDIEVDNVEFEVDVITLSLTYGLLENLDIGALIPYIWLTSRGDVEITVDQSVDIRTSVTIADVDPGTPGNQPDTRVERIKSKSRRKFKDDFDNDYDGFGDIILFIKWQILSQFGLPKRIKGPVDMALQFETKTPTGDEDEFLGTGEWDFALRMLIQRAIGNRALLRGEFGFNRSGLSNDFNTIEYKLGAEIVITDDLSASTEVIGNYSKEFHNIIDMVTGLKYSVTRSLIVFGGLRFPLNDNGLRYRYSPIVGFEYTFAKRFGFGLEDIEAPNYELEGGVDDPFADQFEEGVPIEEESMIDAGGAVEEFGAAEDPAAGESLAIIETESVHIDATDQSKAPETTPGATPPPLAGAGDDELPLPKGRNR